MAELFKNFNALLDVTDREMIVVPTSLNNNDNHKPVKYNTQSFGENTRTLNSVVQIHSLYVSNEWGNRIVNDSRYDENVFKHFDMYIKDYNNSNYRIYVVHDVELVPGCPFYIEKNITLSPSQILCIYAPPSSIVPANAEIKINVIASAIEFISDVE